MKEFDPDIPMAENWRSAAPLGSAWFEYAPPELREQYRDAGRNEHLTATLKQLMEGEVHLKIADGELVALGIKTAPIPEDEARKIPTVFFQAESIIIDWAMATVTGLARAYAEVRVCVPKARHLEAPAAPDRTGYGVAPDKLSEVLRPTQPSAKRSAYPAERIVRRIYAELIGTGEIPSARTLKEAWVIVRARALQDHPEEFPGERGLSYSSFSRHLADK